MPGGQIYEITHRQIGTLIGFLALVLIAVLWRAERRRWVNPDHFPIHFARRIRVSGFGGTHAVAADHDDPADRCGWVCAGNTGSHERLAAGVGAAWFGSGVWWIDCVQSSPRA